MLNPKRIIGSLVRLGFLLALSTNTALAQQKPDIEMPASAVGQTSQFQKIEQPLSLKLAVALGGLGLIGAELWWFISAKAPK